ncbi:MAG: septum formation initiator family protein [Oscillospiraceae bacterium]
MRKLFTIKGVAFFALIAYLSVSLVSAQFELMTKKQELSALEQQEQRLKMENQDAQRLLDSEDENAYIERIARQRLGYANPNEKVYIDIQGE